MNYNKIHGYLNITKYVQSSIQWNNLFTFLNTYSNCVLRREDLWSRELKYCGAVNFYNNNTNVNTCEIELVKIKEKVC